MENEAILKKLLDNLKMIKGITSDDGYAINRISGIGSISATLLKQLDIDDEEQKIFIKQAIEQLDKTDVIASQYFDDPEYQKFINKQSRAGNVHLFMKAIHCVEGALEVFLSRVGWYNRQ